MSRQVYASNEHETAVLAAVKTIWPLTGDAATPADISRDDKGRITEPYAIVYPIGSGAFDGSIDDPQQDAWPVTQITYVGRTREQASGLRQKVRTQLLGQQINVAGRQVGPMELDQELPIQRDDDVSPPLFYAVDRYRAYSTPD